MLVDSKPFETVYHVCKPDEDSPTTGYGEKVMTLSAEQAQMLIAPTVVEQAEYNGFCLFALETICEDSVVNEDMVICTDCYHPVE